MWKKKNLAIIILGTLWLSACFGVFPAPILSTPGPLRGDEDIMATNEAQTSVPAATSVQPTPTTTPIKLRAKVWSELPQVPILMYHRFTPQGNSYGYTTSLSDFDGHLTTLYEAGFSLISLSDWLHGVINVPTGRRPLIITIDDLFYGDQISLDENGEPAPYSGVGRLWAFSQAHPDFNFHVALFYNLGDKLYANDYNNGVFSVKDGWRKDRAEAIAWGIEHGAIPLNHFYNHPFLNQLTPAEIKFQLEENDRVLREDLAMLGKQHLAKKLPNILALPYLAWPTSEAGVQVLFDYTTPEGAPLLGIMGGTYGENALLLSSPFAEDFDPYHVARMDGSWQGINLLIEKTKQIATADRCDLGLFPNGKQTNPGEISEVIFSLTQQGTCPEGYYFVKQWAFWVDNDEVIQLVP
jgi:hypothetical protein